MTNHDEIKEEKLQYHINKEAGKRPAFLNKYEYLTGEEILSFNWKQTIEQTKFAYSPL